MSDIVPSFHAIVSSLSSATSHVISMPAITVGDVLLMVFFIGTASANLPPGPAGWTAGPTSDMTGTGMSYAMYYRTADGTEGASVTLTTAVSQVMNAAVASYSGSGGIDVISGAQVSAATPVHPPTISVPATQERVVTLICLNGSGITFTAPTSWTQRQAVFQTGTGYVQIQDFAQASRGSTGQINVNATGGSKFSNTGAVTVSLAPPSDTAIRSVSPQLL